MNIKNILDSGAVVRFHSTPGVDKQLTAEHQWGVAMIVQHIEPDCSKNLLLAAMLHDAAEVVTGDVPFPIKRKSKKLKGLLDDLEKDWEAENGISHIMEGLRPHETMILKVADTLEGMWYCTRQLRDGNKAAKAPFLAWSNAINSIKDRTKLSPRAEELLDLIYLERRMWQ